MISAFVSLLAVGAAGLPAPVAIPLKPYIERLVTADLKVDGVPGRFIFDTGGGVTTLTPDFAAKVGCKPYGEISGFRMTGQRVRTTKCGVRTISTGGYRRSAETLSADLMSLLPPGSPPVDGVLALNAFSDGAVTLELNKRRLIVETPASLRQRTSRLKPGSIRVMREMGGMGLTAFARLPAATGDLWFLVDSGNMANILASPGALEQWGLDEAARKKAVEEKRAEVPLKVDGAPDAPPRVAIRDLIYDGALNEVFLRHYAVTLDLKQQKVWYGPTEE